MSKLSDETHFMHYAMVSLMDKPQTVAWHHQRAETYKDTKLKSIQEPTPTKRKSMQ